MSDLSVGITALRSDADVWDAAAHGLTEPRHAAQSLPLTRADVMCYAANLGFDRQYNDMCARLADIIRQANENFFNVGFVLRATAMEYEQSETTRAHNIREAGGH